MEFNAESYKTLFYLSKISNDRFENLFSGLVLFGIGNYAGSKLFKLTAKSSDNQKTMDLEWYSFLNALACVNPNLQNLKAIQSIQKCKTSII